MKTKRFLTNKSWGYDVYTDSNLFIGTITRLRKDCWTNSTDNRKYSTKKAAIKALCELEIEFLDNIVKQSKDKIEEIKREIS